MIRKIFGEKLENEIYHDREAAYVVLLDGDKIAVVKTSSGKLFLPGGKIETGESKEDCVVRECIEEMGAKVTVKEYFAIGERYFIMKQVVDIRTLLDIFSILMNMKMFASLQRWMKNYYGYHMMKQ